jgi:hypothetical protein
VSPPTIAKDVEADNLIADVYETLQSHGTPEARNQNDDIDSSNMRASWIHAAFPHDFIKSDEIYLQKNGGPEEKIVAKHPSTRGLKLASSSNRASKKSKKKLICPPAELFYAPEEQWIGVEPNAIYDSRMTGAISMDATASASIVDRPSMSENISEIEDDSVVAEIEETYGSQVYV